MTDMEMFRTLRILTKNFTWDNLVLHTDYEQEKNQAKRMLEAFYEIVETSDGRMSKTDPPCWVIACAKPFAKKNPNTEDIIFTECF